MSEQFVLAPAPSSALTLTSGAEGTFELTDLAGGLSFIAAAAGEFEIAQPVAQLVVSTTGLRGEPGPAGPAGPAGGITGALNDNVGGAGVFKNLAGSTLHFYGINAASSKITVTLDVAHDEIDIDVVEANLTLANLSGSLTAARISDFATAADLRVTAGINAHLAAGDPHPQYLTLAEGNAAYSLFGHTHLLADVSNVTITAANLNALDDGVNTALHFHDADRARANHTGTQLLATVSDVTIAAANLNALDDGVNTALHFHDADRARANHTGSQIAATISDFTEASQDVIGGLLITAGDLTWTYNDGANTLSAVITANAVTFAKMQDIATARFVGRITAASGDPEELTGTQATTLLDVFTSGLKGLVPASGGGTANFLRADGVFAAPPGGGGSGDVITANGAAASDADFDDATPAAPAGGVNVKWQKDASSPDNISAHVLQADLFPPGHLFGLTMSNAADTVNDITVAAGSARDEANTVGMVLAAARTKQLDAAWAVGDNAGGLNTGAKAANTWYEVHEIMRTDTGVVDIMFTTTANRATLPASYTKQRRINWIRTDGAGAIIKFTQVEDYITLTTQINDVATSPTATATAVALTVPPSCVARFRASLTQTASNAAAETIIVFSEIVEGNVTPAVGTAIASLAMRNGNTTTTANDAAAAGHFELRVSSTSTIEHDSVLGAGIAGEAFDISTFGWIDTRGRLA